MSLEFDDRGNYCPPAFDLDRQPADLSPAARSWRAEKIARKAAGKLDEGLRETFPASDPVAVTNPTRPGRPDEKFDG